MRISDWSSDVCSSDLRRHRVAGHGHRIGARWSRNRVRPLRPRADRKSVVKGKSVSVRVDLGGRRLIKKKTKHSHSHYTLMKKYINTHPPHINKYFSPYNFYIN